jgi:hypothetical protein
MPPGNKKVETAASVAGGDAVRPEFNKSRTLGLRWSFVDPVNRADSSRCRNGNLVCRFLFAAAGYGRLVWRPRFLLLCSH